MSRKNVHLSLLTALWPAALQPLPHPLTVLGVEPSTGLFAAAQRVSDSSSSSDSQSGRIGGPSGSSFISVGSSELISNDSTSDSNSSLGSDVMNSLEKYMDSVPDNGNNYAQQNGQQQAAGQGDSTKSWLDPKYPWTQRQLDFIKAMLTTGAGRYVDGKLKLDKNHRDVQEWLQIVAAKKALQKLRLKKKPKRLARKKPKRDFPVPCANGQFNVQVPQQGGQLLDYPADGVNWLKA